MDDLLATRSGSLSTEQRLKVAAVRAFGRRGYTATSIREIAKDAGLTIGALYHYAPGKEGLFLQLVLEGYAASIPQALAVESKGGPPAERLLSLVRMHIQGEVADRDLWRMSRTELNVLTPESQARIIAQRDEFEAVWRRIIRDGCQTEDFWPVDESIARISLIRMCTSVGDWYTPEGRLSLEEIIDVISKQTLGLMRPRTAP